MARDTEFLLEKIFRRLLRKSSSPSTDGLAAYVYEVGGYGAVLYRPDVLYDEISVDPENACKGNDAYNAAVLGMIKIRKPSENCDGAYEVMASAGRRFGKYVYGLGYAMSENGLLMSDRDHVLKKAYNAWSGQYKKNRPRIELNDSDCFIHTTNDVDCSDPLRDPTPLNYAYEAYGWEFGMQDDLMKVHDQMMRKFDEEFGTAIGEKIRSMLKSRSGVFFWTKI